MPESIMVWAIKPGQNSKTNKKDIIMKKDYSRVGLPNLLQTPAAKTAEPIAKKVEPIVNKEEPKSKKKTKEEKPEYEAVEAVEAPAE